MAQLYKYSGGLCSIRPQVCTANFTDQRSIPSTVILTERDQRNGSIVHHVISNAAFWAGRKDRTIRPIVRI